MAETHKNTLVPSFVLVAPVHFFNKEALIHPKLIFLQPKEIMLFSSMKSIVQILTLESNSDSTKNHVRRLGKFTRFTIHKSIVGLKRELNTRLGQNFIKLDQALSNSTWDDRPILDYEPYLFSLNPKWQTILDESRKVIKQTTRKAYTGLAMLGSVTYKDKHYPNLNAAVFEILQKDNNYPLSKMHEDIKSHNGMKISNSVLKRSITLVNNALTQSRSSPKF